MKKLVLILSVLMFFAGCELTDLPDIPIGVKIVIEYPGQYYIFIQNISGDNSVYVKQVTGNYTLTEGKLESVLSDLGYLKVDVQKVIGELYPDMGTLMVSLYDNNVLMISDIAEYGDREAHIEWQL